MESSITSLYRKSNVDRVLQGDVLTNLKIPIFENNTLKLVESSYSIVLSQDCDLNQDFNAKNELKLIEDNLDRIPSLNNKFLPSILLCPAYPADQLREGIHLQFLELTLSKISNPKKTPWKRVVQNETSRYHFLHKSENLEIPDLVLDFKRYYTVSRDYLYSVYDDVYLVSLNELYHEDLSQRFSNYLSRVGLPF